MIAETRTDFEAMSLPQLAACLVRTYALWLGGQDATEADEVDYTAGLAALYLRLDGKAPLDSLTDYIESRASALVRG